MRLFARRKSGEPDGVANREMQAVLRAHLVARFDMQGTFLEVNDAFCTELGYRRADLVGQSHLSIIRPKDRDQPEVRELWAQMARGEVVNRIQPRLDSSGNERWFDITYVPVEDAQGQHTHVLAVAREISAMHFRRRDNRGQVDAVRRSMAVIEFDLEGRVLDANPLFLKAMGYRIEEIRGRHHRMFVDPDEAGLPEYQRFWQRLAQGSSERGEVRRLRRDGSVIWLQSTYETVFDPEGKPIKVVKYAFDVTAARNLAADAASQIAAIQKVQGVIEFDTEGKVLRANALFARTMGYGLEELQGRHHSMFVTPEHARSPDYAAFWAKLRSGQEVEGDFIRIGRGGRQVHIRASYNPIRDAAGKVVKVVKFAIDTSIFHLTAETMRQALEALAAGDLQARVETNLGELDSLRHAYNDAVSRVSNVMYSVTDRSAAVFEEAGAIATATQELARRTEQQAATLEESAAALDQLTASVSGAAQAASAARDKAAEAKARTDHSGRIVGDAVQAMDEIAQSSSKISSITNVIDDIAFQTNLLALNAGVEAARAGDAGRGFAVVASEVRALAQRSSEAAREIATLISASTTQVGRGVELVGQAGAALRTIDEIVHEINTSVTEIANSAGEQALSLGEMNTAVNQLDQATQRNAAMAEESNAAVQTLADGIAAMQEEVAYFNPPPLTAAAALPARRAQAG